MIITENNYRPWLVFTLILSVLFGIFSYWFVSRGMYVKENGRMVTVPITENPFATGGVGRLTFKYNGEVHRLRNIARLKKYNVGDTLHLIHHDDLENLFLYPEDNPSFYIFLPWSTIFIDMFLIYCWFKYK